MGGYIKSDRVSTNHISGRIPSMTIPEKACKESSFINYHKSNNNLAVVVKQQVKDVVEEFKKGEAGFLWNPENKYFEKDCGHVLVGPITNYQIRNIQTGKLSKETISEPIEYATIQGIIKSRLLCNVPDGKQIIVSFNNKPNAINRDIVYFSDLELKL